MKALVNRFEPKVGRCATCRWAELGSSGQTYAALFCRRVNQPNALAVLATPRDGGLIVEPDFGCVMWEAKP